MEIMSGLVSLFCLSVLSVSAAAAPTKAAVKLSTQGILPTGSQLAGIAVAIQFPSGVTVSTEANGVVQAGVVNVSGVAAASGITAVGPKLESVR